MLNDDKLISLKKIIHIKNHFPKRNQILNFKVHPDFSQMYPNSFNFAATVTFYSNNPTTMEFLLHLTRIHAFVQTNTCDLTNQHWNPNDLPHNEKNQPRWRWLGLSDLPGVFIDWLVSLHIWEALLSGPKRTRLIIKEIESIQPKRKPEGGDIKIPPDRDWWNNWAALEYVQTKKNRGKNR